MVPKRKARIINSALWAAAGDAIGWITELTDARGVKRRVGHDIVKSPTAWVRKIGGFRGVDVNFPAGAYSDDTQLRLAVSRSITADGTFDVEAFAKIELTVWPSYALGAGRGTKAAANNLSKRDVNWFSNFFAGKDGGGYTSAGGNGAAMRIQPHVWACGTDSKNRGYLLDVIRNAVTTHGHMLGVCGAVFHADCLSYALDSGKLPGPNEWLNFVYGLKDIERLIGSDDQLGRFWRGAWEQTSGITIAEGIDQVRQESERYVGFMEEAMTEGGPSYERILDFMDCRGARQGAGMNTALAAAYICWLMKESDASEVLIRVANTLGSDTDTIGTMAGALVGAVSTEKPLWDIQDKDYIEYEARRMSAISDGLTGDSFGYPDISMWQPPGSQVDSFGYVGDKAALRGLGYGQLIGDNWKAGDYVWQWFRLEFGQTVLCKSLATRKRKILPRHLPGERVPQRTRNEKSSLIDEVRGKKQAERRVPSPSLGLFSNFDSSENDSRGRPAVDTKMGDPNISGDTMRSIDELTNLVIRSNFDESMVGLCLKECVQGSNGIERAIAFASIVAKAIIARQRKA